MFVQIAFMQPARDYPRIRKSARVHQAVPQSSAPACGTDHGSTQLRQLALIAGGSPQVREAAQLQHDADRSRVVQRQIVIDDDDRKFNTYGGNNTKSLINDIKQSNTDLKRGWIKEVAEMAADFDEKKHTAIIYKFGSFKELLEQLLVLYPNTETSDPYDRPGFSKRAYFLAAVVTSLAEGKDLTGMALGENDLALPHRMSFRDIRESTRRFADGNEKAEDLKRWTDRLIKGTEKRINESNKAFANAVARIADLKKKRGEKGPSEEEHELTKIVGYKGEYATKASLSLTNAENSRKKLLQAYQGTDDKEKEAAIKAFLKAFNEIHGNIPDIGQHVAINISVSSRGHAHFIPIPSKDLGFSEWEDEDSDNNEGGYVSTPGTETALNMTPNRIPNGFALDDTGESSVGPQGQMTKLEHLEFKSKKKLKFFDNTKTKITPKKIRKDKTRRIKEGQFVPQEAGEESRPAKRRKKKKDE